MKYYCIDPVHQTALVDSDGAWISGTAVAFPNTADPTTPDPNQYAVPAHAVINPPPQLQRAKQAAVAQKIEWTNEGYPIAQWELIDDHRGDTWLDQNGNQVVIDVLGDPSAMNLRTHWVTPDLERPVAPTEIEPPKPSNWLARLFGGRNTVK